MSLLLRRTGFYVIYLYESTLSDDTLFLSTSLSWFFFESRWTFTLGHLNMEWTSCRPSVNAPVSLTRASERDVVRSRLAIRMSKYQARRPTVEQIFPCRISQAIRAAHQALDPVSSRERELS